MTTADAFCEVCHGAIAFFDEWGWTHVLFADEIAHAAAPQLRSRESAGVGVSGAVRPDSRPNVTRNAGSTPPLHVSRQREASHA